MTVTAGVSVDLTLSAVGHLIGANDLASVESALSKVSTVQLRPGTGAGKADKAFFDTRTLAASATENLDLAGGLSDPFGVTLTFVKVKAILVFAHSGNTNDVVVGGAASNTFTGPFADATDKAVVPPGGFLAFVAPGAGWTVTASTGDILKIANSAGTTGVDYDIVIIGTSA